MRDILNLGLRLLIITMVAALCLAGTNLLTKDAIEARSLEATASSRAKVLPSADAFEPLDLAAYPIADDPAYKILKEVCRGTKDGETVGYVISLAPNGYKAEIPITIGIDDATGEIVDVAIGDIQETAGLGTKVAEAPFITQFAGLFARENVVAQSVETISGATISSRACVTAVKLAAAFYETYLDTKDRPGPITYEAMVMEELSQEAYADIVSLERAVQDEVTVGYRFQLSPQGYVAEIPITLSIDAMDSIITGVEIGEISETEGVGTKIKEESFLVQFFGVKASPGAVSHDVETISGATVSSRACVTAVMQAMTFYETYLREGADASSGATEASEGKDAGEASEGEDATSGATAPDEAAATDAPAADTASGATGEANDANGGADKPETAATAGGEGKP